MIQQHKTNASSPILLIESHRHTSYQSRLLYLTLLMNTLSTTTTTTTTYRLYLHLPTYLLTRQPTNQPTSPFPLPTPHPPVPPSLRPSPDICDTHTTYTPSSSPSRQRGHQINESKKNPHPPTRLQQKKREKEELESEVGCLYSHTHTLTHTHTRARTRRRQVGSPSSRGKQVDSTHPLPTTCYSSSGPLFPGDVRGITIYDCY